MTPVVVGTGGSGVRPVQWFLALSIGLHALALLLLPLPQPEPGAGLRLEIRFAAERRPQNAAALRRELPREPQRRITSAPPAATSPAAPRFEHLSPPDAAHGIMPPTAPASPGAASTELMDAARRIAREAGRQPSTLGHRGNTDDYPAFPELARAMARGKLPPGVTRFADGLLKVVTPSGSVYCLQPPPAFTHGGPTEPLAVPSNCP